MNDQGAGNDTGSFADNISSVGEYRFSFPKTKGFQPWHKPRKQFVRKEQWCYFIGQLLDDLPTQGRTLTYFGLPGDDLLDLRCFGSSVCEPREIKLRFLGFNNSAAAAAEDQTELNISLDEVSKSASFDPQSEILADDMRELVNTDSIAWHKTSEIGPYDVINLDLCDGFGAQSPGSFDETYYNMVVRLLSVQARRKSPWLLLLTTRVGKAHVHTETLNRLAGLYRLNLAECAPFQAASSEKFSISDSSSLDNAKKSEAGIQSVFLVGLCKWLLRLAAAHSPPSIMEVKSALGYRVHGGASVEDMVSIAIRFNPTFEVAKDPVNLATIEPTPIDECDLATKALKRVSSMLDVDEYLASESDIRQEMIDEMCTLLEAARYDTDEYRKQQSV
ncbi:hypothetical protein [Bradyrhizobium sp. Cp5.3]|uniref:PP_RS20740 family protein n=1 Tax=Bradyrhizobium sp. Cp5.3 TaxID=443598 RepID=UPI000400B70A|nr:hypothetical protein [Bradyrhizobium sp. Cp5.3]